MTKKVKIAGFLSTGSFHHTCRLLEFQFPFHLKTLKKALSRSVAVYLPFRLPPFDSTPPDPSTQTVGRVSSTESTPSLSRALSLLDFVAAVAPEVDLVSSAKPFAHTSKSPTVFLQRSPCPLNLAASELPCLFDGPSSPAIPNRSNREPPADREPDTRYGNQFPTDSGTGSTNLGTGPTGTGTTGTRTGSRKGDRVPGFAHP